MQHGKASWNACFQVAANNETDGATFGELSYEEQSKISHRKKAIERFLNYFSGFRTLELNPDKSLSSSYRNETRETNDLPLERACKQTLYKYPITIFQQRVFKVRSACIISA